MNSDKAWLVIVALAVIMAAFTNACHKTPEQRLAETDKWREDKQYEIGRMFDSATNTLCYYTKEGSISCRELK